MEIFLSAVRQDFLCALFAICWYFENKERWNEALRENVAVGLNLYEPRHDKTNKMTAPSEDSDQPGHPPSLIRVFTVRMKKAWVLSYPLSASEDSDQTGRLPGWSESSLGAHAILLVLSWGGSIYIGIIPLHMSCRPISTENTLPVFG